MIVFFSPVGEVDLGLEQRAEKLAVQLLVAQA